MKNKISFFIILMLIGNYSYADFGWSDSPVFHIDLLSRYSTSYSWTDSQRFSLNLLNIHRGWADSSSFSVAIIVEDINGDKTIDGADLQTMAQNWLSIGCDYRNHCDGADADQDNDVDFEDFNKLASFWLISF